MAEREAERLRATEPPAASEVRELRSQEVAAQQAAAQADATGNATLAASQRRLAEELGQVRAAAEHREQEQRQQIATLAADADRRAVAERAELDQRTAAAERAAAQRVAQEQRVHDQRLAGWGLALAVAAGIFLAVRSHLHPSAVDTAAPVDREQRISWRMPPLALLTRPTMSTGRRLGLTVLRGYLVIAAGMVVVRIVQLALAQH